MSSVARLDDWIRGLRDANAHLPNVAKAVAKELETEIRTSVAAQVSMDGRAWLPTKSGKAALQNAASKIVISVFGNTIVMRMGSPEVYHQFGSGRLPQRAILPMGGVPQKLGNAIRRGFVDLGTGFMTRKGAHR